MKRKNLNKFIFLGIFFLGIISYAQKIRPNTAIENAPNRVNNPNDAIDDDPSTFAQINSYGGPLIGIGSYSGTLALGYTNPAPANSNLYLKINSGETGLLDALLGGSLGNLLKGILGVVIGGEHVTTFNLKNDVGDNIINVNTNTTDVNQDKITIAKDASQNYYAIFYPKENKVKTIEITDQTTFSLFFGGINNFKVYDSYYYNNNTSDCDVSLLTSYTASGGILSLINSAPVTNAHYAIDNDLTTYSTIGITSLLNLSAAGTVEQFFYIPKATENKVVKLKIRMPSGLLKLDVGSQSSIIFYKNGVQVSSVNLNSSVLGLDLLGLINQNNAEFSFLASPRDANGNLISFDKVGIRINKPLSVNLVNAEDIRVYDFALVDDTPESKTVCSVETINNNIRTRKFDITQIIPNYDPNYTGYVIVDRNQKEIPFSTTAQKDANKWQELGTYYIKGINGTNYCPNQYESFTAVEDKQYQFLGKTSYSIPLDGNNDGNPDSSATFTSSILTSQLPNNTGVKIYDELTNLEVTNQTVSFSKIGTYNYYAKSINASGTCDIVKRITIYVYDKNECEFRYYQRLASSKSTGTVLTGGTNDSELSVDNDLSTFGTIFNVLSIAGIGTSWIDLKFDNVATKPITAGIPVNIKLGQDYGVLQLIGGITIQALDKNGSTVGPLKSIGELDLLNLLVGTNVMEFSFIPKDSNGNNIEYGGVRVLLGSVLGLANSARVYGAYIDDRIPLSETATCNSNIEINGAEIVGNAKAHLILNRSTKDVLYGVQDAGLGVATALSGVLYPYLAADAMENSTPQLNGSPNYETGAIFNTSVSVLNRQTLTVRFKDVARPGDKVQIVMGSEGLPILDLKVLGGLTIQRYLGDTPIGDEVSASDVEIIKLDLLELISNQSSNKTAVILDGIGASFDRVEIRMDNVVSANLLGDKTYVYDVSVIPYFGLKNEESKLCTSTPLEVEALDPCTAYQISFAYATKDINDKITAWNDIPNSTINLLPNGNEESFKFKLNKLYKEYSSNNNLYLKVNVNRQGCQYGETQYIPVKVSHCQIISNPMIRSRLKSPK
ncbi:hypothetical protein [Chishuiella sp.]|uniref:hypothetical protein n=1 Tax=Chishuiella sp. TaxID=1969467 RepID=UPI0028B22C03|nr:hypothetical protein [Chishuiella sp.]